MEINTHEEFIQLLNDDRGLYKCISTFYAQTFEHIINQFPLNQANEKTSEDIWDDLLSDAFTEDIKFNNPEKEAKEWLIENMGVSYAFAQNGNIL